MARGGCQWRTKSDEKASPSFFGHGDSRSRHELVGSSNAQVDFSNRNHVRRHQRRLGLWAGHAPRPSREVLLAQWRHCGAELGKPLPSRLSSGAGRSSLLAQLAANRIFIPGRLVQRSWAGRSHTKPSVEVTPGVGRLVEVALVERIFVRQERLARRRLGHREIGGYSRVEQPRRLQFLDPRQVANRI